MALTGGNDELFAGAGQMAALMRQLDWADTPLGPVSTWPQSLKTIARVLLTSRFAMWMGWGQDLTFFYNDAYASTLGAKHPWALGKPSREVWAEIWADIGPRIDHVLKTGEATWDEELQLFLERNGYPEETYHTFSYSPITDDHGVVSGNMCVVTEQTDRVIGERRMALLRDTAAGIAATKTEGELFAGLRTSLTGALDLPFTLTYLFDDRHEHADLVCATGIDTGHRLTLARVTSDAPHPLWRWARSGEPQSDIVDLSVVPAVRSGPWSKPSTRALVVPIAQQGQERAAGAFIAALNPFRPVDHAYVSFVDLLVGQIAAGLASAKAYENERRRVEALAEIDRAKTAFFSNVSHEFRTPLTLMVGPLEDLMSRPDGEVPAAERDVLQVVHRNSLRLLKLVNTLLDYSRIEAGRVRARFAPVDLAVFTAELASTFRSAMAKAELEFRVACPPIAQSTYVDRDMWEKVVLNLISNAFKFTLRGFVAVRLREEPHRVVLEVEDSGAGIPDAELPHVFERFHRVEGALGRSHEGSGIGLALVHELVKVHGGELRAESRLGKGSCFSVTIPTGAAHLPAEQLVSASAAFGVRENNPFAAEALGWLPDGATNTPAASEAAVPSAAARGRARVLLADDNADMREYAHRLLSQQWDVEAVTNGREALARARVSRPDVIVSDVMMPEMDGFGLLRALRADPVLHPIPFVMLSARAGEEARLEGLAASADDYLVKPFSARELLGRVEAQVIKSRERALEREHGERLKRLFTHAPVAIAILRGPHHVYELTNARYVEVVGGRELVGKTILEALPELSGQGFVELLDAVRQSGEPYIGQSRRVMLNRGPLGQPEEAYFDFVYQPTFDADGHVDSIVVVAHDVTQLAKAKGEAESANRLKDEFLATLSHELRTPLNAVLGYVQMLRGGLIDAARVPAVLDTIERNAQLQEQLVNDVLDVSRIITGKLRLDIRPISLADVISDAIETVMPAATAKGVRLQSVIDQPGVPVAGDAQRLQQVVWNVLSNAVKFTPRGGRVQARLQRIDSHVEITVADTGEGIAPEFFSQLFQRFSQGDGSFTRTHSGLGLGLAISRHLVEAHGGTIEAHSPGKGLGTTIRIALPLMIVHDEAFESADRVHPAVDIPGAPLGMTDLSGTRVLLVDDDVDALGMARDALKLSGAHVVAVHGANEAIAALDGETFDVAVFDIGMPNTDGYELLKRVRERSASDQGNVPALALTAYARPTDRTRSLQAGFQLHLAKPVRPSELSAAVAMLADRFTQT